MAAWHRLLREPAAVLLAQMSGACWVEGAYLEAPQEEPQAVVATDGVAVHPAAAHHEDEAAQAMPGAALVPQQLQDRVPHEGEGAWTAAAVCRTLLVVPAPEEAACDEAWQTYRQGIVEEAV